MTLWSMLKTCFRMKLVGAPCWAAWADISCIGFTLSEKLIQILLPFRDLLLSALRNPRLTPLRQAQARARGLYSSAALRLEARLKQRLSKTLLQGRLLFDPGVIVVL